MGGADRLVVQLQVPYSADVVLPGFSAQGVGFGSLFSGGAGVTSGLTSGRLSGAGGPRRGPPISPIPADLFANLQQRYLGSENNRNVALAFSQRRLSEQDKISVQIYGKFSALRVKIWFGEFKGRE